MRTSERTSRRVGSEGAWPNPRSPAPDGRGHAVLDWLRRARQGDPDALGHLLEVQRDALLALARRQLGVKVAARVDASDVVQQTFLEAYRCFERFDGDDEPAWSAWLHQILAYKIATVIRDHVLLRKRDARREQPLATQPDDAARAAPEPASDQSSPSQRAIRAEDHRQLTDLLDRLPEEQRVAVRLRYVENLPLIEIAARLGRSRDAAAGLLKRGLQALRAQLPPEA